MPSSLPRRPSPASADAIRAVADAIETEAVVGLAFDMSTYGAADDVGDCGTAACVAGTTYAMRYGVGALGKAVVTDVHDEARALLGLSPSEARDLFLTYTETELLYGITRAQAAGTLRHFAETGEIVWELDV